MRGKVRNRATAVTQWPAADQSGQPIRTQIQQIIDETPGGAGTGDVVGPGSAVTNHVVSFDGTTGKLVKDSGVLVADVVQKTRLVSTGSGLSGGGDLSADRTLAADFGSGAGKVTQGNDARLSDARTPTAHSHPESDVTGLVADLGATEKTANKNAASGYAGLDASSKLTGSQQKYGSAANTAAEGNDPRLGDARTPTAHAASHRSGGSDPLVFDQTTSATGTQNNFSLNGPNTVLECSGAAPVFTGFTVAGSAPVGGDRAVLVYTGSGTLRVPKDDALSTAANRITSPSARGQIVGVGGKITLVYESATSRWGVQAVEPGVPIPVAYTAGDFTGDVGTWTVDAGDLSYFAYQQEGAKLTLSVSILSSTVSGAPTYLRILIPNGFTISKFIVGPAAGSDNGVGKPLNALVYSVLSTTLLHFNLVAGGTWANATNATNVFAVFPFQVD